MTDLTRLATAGLERLDAAGRRRRLIPTDRITGPLMTRNGREMVNFSSNNYLGLAGHPLMEERSKAFIDTWGTGSTSSRLVCGDMAPFHIVEDKLAAAKGKEAALVFSSGFSANSALLPALLEKDLLGAEPLVFADRLNHASLHHGLAAAGARQIRFRHGDMTHLDSLLEKHADNDRPKFIVTESVFSMDGDRSDMDALCGLATKHSASLIIDEAHATGILGETGFGLAAHRPEVSVVMGTFSKAMGGFGAYVAADRAVIDYLISRSSGFIYTTGLPPAVLGSMDAALDLVPQLSAERAYVAHQADLTRAAFNEAGLDTGPSSTQIVPVMIGSEHDAMAFMAALEAEGLLGIAIRPPTVPPGSSRIRFALSSMHTQEHMDRLRETVVKTAHQIGIGTRG